MKKRNVFGFLAMMVLLNGCKDYLDLKSDASYVVPSSLKDIQGLMDDAQRMNMSAAYPVAAESLADDYYLSDNTFNTRSENEKLMYVWALKEYYTGNEWAQCYSVVHNANLALELLAKVVRTEENATDWDRVRGTALFYRAFQFLALVTLHGHAFDEATADQYLGIPLRMTSDFNVKSTRATVRACYDLILKDLKEAVELLPDRPVHVLRPSKAAAYGLLARTTLFMGRYEEARLYAGHALQLHDVLMDFNSDPDIVGLGAQYTFREFNKETIFYVRSTGAWIYTRTVGIIDSVLYSSYREGDLRKRAFFNTTGGLSYFKGNFTGNNVSFCGITTSELYLMRAEASAFLGDVDSALDDVNALMRSRWDRTLDYWPLEASSREEAVALVRTERRKELLMRSLRWIDIKRYNREGARIVLKRTVGGVEHSLLPHDPYYAFPLPADIIQQTGMPQN